MKIPVNVPCCVCSSKESTVLHETVYPEYGYPETFVMNRCSSCGLLFNSPRLIDEKIASLRERNGFFFDPPDDEEFFRVTTAYRRSVALAEKDVSKKIALEIGSGHGHLLALMNRLGWRAQGVELSPSAAEDARKKFGVNVFAGTFEKFLAGDHEKSYGLILLNGALEQASAPAELLAQAKNLLASGGTLVIDTPNGNAYNINRDKHRWQGFSPFHVFLFSEENLTRLLKQTGFAVRQIFSYDNEESKISCIASGAKECLRKTPLWNPLRRLWRKLRTPPPRPFDFYFARFQDDIRKVPDYFADPDSNLGLRLYNRGDNLMVIASPVEM